MNERGRKKKRFSPDELKKIEGLAAQQMSNKEICIVLGISQSLFYEERNNDLEFSEAIERGRALGIQLASQTVLACIRNKDGAMALKYLQTYAERWKPEKIQIQHSGTVELAGGIEIKECFSEDTRARVIKYWQREQEEKERNGQH